MSQNEGKSLGARPLQENTTLRDVARQVGVSLTTVSVVLNGARSGTRVSPVTREKILAAAAALNYRPNAVAQGLSRKRMNNLGVLCVEERVGINLYLMALLSGILQTGMEYGQAMTVFGGENWQKVQQNLTKIGEGRCDGFLLIGTPEKSDLIDALKQRSFPLVLINENARDSELTCVDVENVLGAKAMVSYLLEQGHRRIALLCGEETQVCTQERREGYYQALAEAGVPVETSLVMPGTYSEFWGGANARALMQLPSSRRPTALFCSNDAIAAGALQALCELDVTVPDEMSVVGFDDVLTSALLRPPLTTMKQPFEQIGRRAVEILMAQIAGEIAPGYKERLPSALIVRGSVQSLPTE